MLPDGRDDAMAVLECVGELVTAFLQADAPEPAKAKIVTLVRDWRTYPPERRSTDIVSKPNDGSPGKGPPVHARGFFPGLVQPSVKRISTLGCVNRVTAAPPDSY